MQVKCPRLGCDTILEGEDRHRRMVRLGIHFVTVHGYLLQYSEAELLTIWAENIEEEKRKNPPPITETDREEDNMT